MQRKDPLGRGLGAILKDIEEKTSISLIPVERISFSPLQPRQRIDEESLYSLAQSVKEKGILQPLILRKKGDSLELVAGERRLRAAIIAGLKEVPCVIREFDDREALEIALIENLQREDLNPIELAQVFKRFTEELGYTQEELARKLGLDRTSISNTMRLLKLPDWIKEKIASGEISSGHGRILLSIGDEEKQKKYIERILKEKISVREIEREARKKTDKKEEVFELEDRLRDYLKTRVQITYKKGKGRIIIEFYGIEDLRRLAESLLPSNI